jgi:hypothetical protein
MVSRDIWTYIDAADDWSLMDVVGYQVHATDAHIGKVDEKSHEAGDGYIVVDTGPWILGKKVMLPAGVINRIDIAEEKVYVDRTKDEIKNAPEFDQAAYRGKSYREALGGYSSQSQRTEH